MMKFKNMILIIVLIVCILSISSINAENETDIVSNSVVHQQENLDVSDCRINESISNIVSIRPNIEENIDGVSQMDKSVANFKPLNLNVKVSNSFNLQLVKCEVVSLGISETPIENATINLTINGENYNRRTDAMGIARINMNLPIGSYFINYSYEGNDLYYGASNYIVINVYSGNAYINYYNTEIDKTGNFEVVAFNDNGGRLTNKVIHFTSLSKVVEFIVVLRF